MRLEVDRHRVVHETIDGEAILIQMKTGFYYSLEGVGSEIWGAVVAGYAPNEIEQLLRTRYQAPPGAIEAAVSGLLEELLNEGLVDEVDEPSPGGERATVRMPADGDTTALMGQLEAPVLHRYTDMADFMLVDPIHEVEETSWPNRKVAP